MSRAPAQVHAFRSRRVRAFLWLLSPLILASSCKENLPSGPATFTAALALLGLPDTLVVGDSRVAEAHAMDAHGNQILALAFAWTVADTSVAGLGTADSGSGRTRTVLARRTGRSQVTIRLADRRFVVSDVAKQLTSVVGGVRLATSRDTSLTAINDTAVAAAAGLVRFGTVLVPKAGQGLRWLHLGVATTGAGQGDTLRYVARANGVDTLIASHDFCLAGARCADTALVRIAQQLKLALSSRNFQAWSLGDSVGPSITLVDRRGNGLVGAAVRFVPVTRADSLIVSVTGSIGVSNPVTGQMAVPRLVATANGSARARVLAVGPTGTTVDVDSITAVVRQVARRVAVEPLRAQITEVDSIPVKPNARDARGRPIADASLTAIATGVVLSNGHAVGVPRGSAYTGTLRAILTGVADPANNPGAPQVPFAIDTALVQVAVADSAVAGATGRMFSMLVLGATAIPLPLQWVRFFATGGAVAPDSSQTDLNGSVTASWTPPNVVGRYTFTGLLRSGPTPVTLADSTGLIIHRRSLFVTPGLPDTAQSTVLMSATTIPASATAMIFVAVRDMFGNAVTSAKPTDIVITAGSGAIGAITCISGTCTATYTAPAAPGVDTVTVTIGGVAIRGSPVALTIT